MVYDFYISELGVVRMTLLEIGFVMVFWTITIVMFYSMGVDSGYKEGRRAVQKFYEQRDKVRA